MCDEGCSVRWAMTVLVLLGAGLSAAAQSPSLEVEVPAHAVTVGDRVTVRVTARGDAETLWGELTVATDAESPWVVADGPREVRGSVPPSWEVGLAALEVGELPLPELAVSARLGDGEPIAVSPEAPPLVTVATVLAPEDEGEPAPLADPVGVSGFPWEWAPPIAAVVLPVAALLAWWWWRRRGRTTGQASQPPLAPFEELQRLAKALAAKIGRDPAEGVCDQLAAGLRRYLERRSGEPALEMTSFELRGLCRRRDWPGEVQRAVHEVMGVADDIRYARRRVADGALHQAVELAVAAGHGLEAHVVEQHARAEGSGT